MMIYISIIRYHTKSHHIGKLEENLRPCVDSLHYKMLHDYRELILTSYSVIEISHSNVCVCSAEDDHDINFSGQKLLPLVHSSRDSFNPGFPYYCSL